MNRFKWWWLCGLPLFPLVIPIGMLFCAGEFGNWLWLKINKAEKAK